MQPTRRRHVPAPSIAGLRSISAGYVARKGTVSVCHRAQATILRIMGLPRNLTRRTSHVGKVAMQSVGVTLLGLGTVGAGVARLLTEQRERLRLRSGLEFELRYVVVRDPTKRRNVTLPPCTRLTTDAELAVTDPGVQIVVELWGGVEPTRRIVQLALQNGKNVVTANKALLAEHGTELFEQADENGCSIAFEASVAGAIPIVGALAHGLSANRIQAVRGILNGTSNYILTRMTDERRSYSEALAEAQAAGYAEADPTLDVDGTDAAQKLAILTQLAFGTRIPLSQIHREGITRIHPLDLQFAAELGYNVRMVAVARRQEDGLEVRVAPCLLRQHTPLAEVRGVYNAIEIEGDAAGRLFIHGLGAGQMATASAVVADLIDTALGRAAITFRMLRMWSQQDSLRVLPPEDGLSRFYYRFTVYDRPGVLAQIARILGNHGVSIASVIQHEPPPDQTTPGLVPLVLMTHTARTRDAIESLREIDRLSVLVPPSVLLRVED